MEASNRPVRVATLLACHNRRERTLACLHSLLHDSRGPVEIDVFLTDDGSTDSTAEAVHAEFPDVTIIGADGSLYWCRGMERAWRAALPNRYDGYLWLNDDVELERRAVGGIIALDEGLRTSGDQWPAIIVGATADPETGRTTYGGYRSTSRWHPGKMRMVEPDPDRPTPIDTFNGNFVYVPARVADRIGIIDPVFSHASADIDYGLRATRASIPVLLAPGHVGTCTRDPRAEATLGTVFGRKGLPWRDWLVFTRRHGRFPTWPIAFAGPYVRAAIASVRRRSP